MITYNDIALVFLILGILVMFTGESWSEWWTKERSINLKRYKK